MAMKTAPSIGLIGHGSWATALLYVLTQNENLVTWYLPNLSWINSIQTTQRNPKYLKNTDLKVKNIILSNSLQEVVRDSDILFIVIPAAFLHQVLATLTPNQLQNKLIVTGIKGIETHTGLTISNYFYHYWKILPENKVLITGPSHAEEVSNNQTTYLTLAAQTGFQAEKVQQLLQNEYIHIKINRDVAGIEYAGILKNVFSIGVGVAKGLGYGDNFIAVLVTQAIRETHTFLTKIAPLERNILKSAYLGDLLVTAYSPHSRNRLLGIQLTQSKSIEEAISEMNMVAEGFYAAKFIHEIIQKYNLSMPICEAVYQLLYEQAKPKVVFKNIEIVL